MNKPKQCEEIGYGQANFLPAALAALDEKTDVVIVVPPRLADTVQRAKVLHDDYFAARGNGERSLRLLLRFGFHGFRTPSLWGVLNKAELKGRVITLERNDRGLVITLLVRHEQRPQPA